MKMDKNRRNKLIALAVLSALLCFFAISSGYAIYVHLTKEPKTIESKEMEVKEGTEKEKEEDILSIEEQFDQENSRFIDPEDAEKNQSDPEKESLGQESAAIDISQDFNAQQEPAALDLTDWIEGKGTNTNYEAKSFSSYQKAFEYANTTNGHFIIEGEMENNQVIYKIRFLENEKGGDQ